MAFSSGTRVLISEAIGWVAAATIVGFGIVHFEGLKALTSRVLGVDVQSLEAAAPSTNADAKSSLARIASGASVELRASRNGHFHTETEINGRAIPVMVDTGATLVALSYEDAERAGIFLTPQDFTGSVNTANGRAKVAPVMLGRVAIGDIAIRDVPALVSEPGRLNTSLLGMSFLGRLSSFEMRSGVLLLTE